MSGEEQARRGRGPGPEDPVSRLLGFEAAGLVLGSVSLDTREERVQLELTTAEGGQQTVVLAKAREGAKSFLRTAHLLLSYRGEALVPAVERWLRGLETRAAGLEWAALAGWAAGREQRPARPSQRRPAAGRQGHPFTLGRPTEWARFVPRGARGAGEAVRLRHRVVSVRHQESECLVSPDVYARPLTFQRYPWHRRAAPWRPPGTCYGDDATPPEGLRLHATDLDERDVILGGTAKVTAALAEAARSPWAELALLSFTCTPTVIGDDRRAAERAWRAATDRPLLTLQDGRDRPGEPLLSLLESEFTRALEAPPPRDPAALALAGYPADVLGPELALLGRLGLRVAARLLPDVYLPDCVPFLGAAVQVVDNRGWLRPFVADLLARLPVPLLRLAPPLGVAATRAWCRAVAAAFGREAALDEAWAAFAAATAGAWDDLRRRAADRRVGFVVAADELDGLWSGALFQDTPVFDAVCELGYGVDVLVHAATAGASGGTGGRRRVERPWGAADVRVEVFVTPRALEERLRASRAGAFYSELTYDWRLTTCGKAAFSYHDLAFGLEGARRNAQLLLALTTPGFFARRGAHLRGRERWGALAAAVEAAP